MTLDDIDLFEINEAFAVVSEKFMRDLDLDRDKVNVNGGAMALGHPIGATGAMLIGTVLDELERQRQAGRPGHDVRRRRHGPRHHHRARRAASPPRGGGSASAGGPTFVTMMVREGRTESRGIRRGTSGP